MQVNQFIDQYWFLLIVPFLVQAIAIAVDEFYFHIKRGLGKWEKVGHPLDTLTVVALYIFCLILQFNVFNLVVYIGLASFSCLFVTKDEFVHKELCEPAEQWLHSILFLVHGLTAVALGFLWAISESLGYIGPINIEIFILAQSIILIIFFLYQITYWNFRAIKGEV